MKDSQIAYVNQTVEIMKHNLSDEPEEMKRQLREVDGRLGYMYFILALANGELDREESKQLEALQRQHEKLSSYEKEVMVKAGVSPYREFRDIIQGQIKASEGRIMLGLGILKDSRKLPLA